jgi:hypothetical protein
VLVYELPSCLLGLVLSDWLDVIDVGKLDSATCSCDRASYLNMDKVGVTISGKEILNRADDGNAVTKWLLERHCSHVGHSKSSIRRVDQ